MCTYRALCLLLISLAYNFQPSAATTIIPLSWKELVYNSDFIGIVQCEKAGGIVAEYEVLESWKGPTRGTHLRIRMAVNYWEPQFPIALVGEKFLVTAFKSHDPTILTSTSSGGAVPLWWRNITAEYSLPLFQGSAKLPLSPRNRPLGSLGSDRTDIDSYRNDVQEFLDLSPARRELSVLKEQWTVPASALPTADSSHNMQDKLALKLSDASSIDEYVSTLVAFEAGQSEGESTIKYTLIRFGGAETLRVLRDDQKDTSALKPMVRKEIIDAIQRRIDDPPGGSESLDRLKTDREVTPSEESLNRMRRLLRGQPKDEQFYEVFDPLTRYQPAVVAEYLVNWVNRGSNWSDHDLGYVLGSYFARNCTKNRRENLTKLLQAKDAFIRVAGAVYLTFEDHEGGVNHLKEFASLPGDPGSWAALVLAERGDKSAVARAIEVFSTPGETNMEGVPHRNLQKRLSVLLSNSAAASRIAQPSPPHSESNVDSEADLSKFQAQTHEYFRSWWNANQETIVMANPWAEILENQKID
jgi:hypothetical protein